MHLDIAILPPDVVSKQVGRVGSKLKKKFKLVFAVDNISLFPHITLLHLETKRRNFKKIRQIVENIAQANKQFRVIYKKFTYSKSRYFNFELKKTAALYTLHRQVVGVLQHLSSYKSTRILNLYNPHITIGRLADSKDQKKLIKEIEGGLTDFLVDNIAITLIDAQAQVTKILKSFPLVITTETAAEHLKRGGIVVYPTDTSYGLAVDATNAEAVKKLYQLKGRDFKKPIHVIFPDTRQLNKIVRLNDQALKLTRKFWPGPLTIVLPLRAKGRSWRMLSAGTGTLGVRVPKNNVALELVEKFRKPITTTSANIAGKLDCYSVAEAKKYFAKHKLSKDIVFLDGGKLKKKKPSTVVSLMKGVKILRSGPISEKQIKHTLNKT